MPLLLGMSCLCLAATGTLAADSKSAASSSRGAGANLLTNPGFEVARAGHPWMPAGWDTLVSGLNTVFYGRDGALVHGGQAAVTIANVSTLFPMWHNWNQALIVDPKWWGKDLIFSVYTRSNGLQGRAYVLLQAYRDSAMKMALHWKVSKDSALARMGVLKVNDPYVNVGWNRQYFSEPETEWVRREVRMYLPHGANVAIVRCGLFGTGQVLFDDASLVLAEPEPQPELPLNTNLLRDPGFEGDGNDWEYSMPPYEGLRIDRDTTVRHGGTASVRLEGGTSGPVQTRAGVCQVIPNRNISGKRLRLSGHIKTDSLVGLAYIKVFCTTLEGDVHEPTPRQIGGNTDWTKLVMEVDTPPNTLLAWAWFLYNAPAPGRLYYDDVALEVLGPAEYIRTGAPPPKPLPLPAR
jgi:hypothetical protein